MVRVVRVKVRARARVRVRAVEVRVGVYHVDDDVCHFVHHGSGQERVQCLDKI